MKRILMSLLAACVFTVSTTGCWGSFTLTKKVYDFNKGWGNKWVSWIVFLLGGEAVLGVSMLVDTFILNSWEFWFNSKLISYHETDAEGNSVTAVKMEDGSLYMRLDAKTGESQELVLQRDEDIVRILDAKGNLLKEAAYAE